MDAEEKIARKPARLGWEESAPVAAREDYEKLIDGDLPTVFDVEEWYWQVFERQRPV